MEKNNFGLLVLMISRLLMNSAQRKHECHCEHPKGAWQSHLKRRDCFASLAMTILIVGFLLISNSFAFAETDDYVTFETGSGSYSFTLQGS